MHADSLRLPIHMINPRPRSKMALDRKKGAARNAMQEDMRVGLDLWCSGRQSEAEAHWESVAQREPKAARWLAAIRAKDKTGAQVIDISDRFGADLSAEQSEEVARSRRLASALADARCFDAALKVLHAARREYANVESIPRSIRMVAGRWLSSLTRSLGSLDLVPRIVTSVRGADYLEGVEDLLGLIDGVSTYNDILACSHLGRLHTCRLLVSLKNDGVIVAGSSPRAAFSPGRRRITRSMRRYANEARNASSHGTLPPNAEPPEDNATGATAGTDPWLSAVAATSPPSPATKRLPSPAGWAATAVGTAATTQVTDGADAPGNEAPPSVSPPSVSPPSISPPSASRPCVSPPSVSPPSVSPPSVSPPSTADHAVESASPRSSRDDFNALFKKATRAYITRNLELAMALFDRCEQLRPGDSRVAHNMAAVRQRMRKRDNNRDS